MIERSAAALVAMLLAAGAVHPAVAANAMKMSGARFGGSVFTGRPKWQNTVALVRAGGGPENFETIALLGVLAGSNVNAEVAKLTKRFGAASVKQFIVTFDFVIADALRLAKKNGVVLPASPEPDPKDGKALAGALYAVGVAESTGKYNVEFMLDHLVSHPVHVQIMKDIDALYGVKADAAYHVIFFEMMTDLKAASMP